MKEKKGKIFNTQEVQAIIAGKKTMFREVAKNPYSKEFGIMTEPKFQVGQEIFVKEAFVDVVVGAVFGYRYYTGKQILYKDYDVKWKSPVHMKQEHSRITLKIKSVKVQRLQDISEEDARREGFIEQDDISNPPPIEQFANYWNSSHKKQEHKWEANFWVFVYEFEVINFKK